jgi:Co/Zn/Cd efflux system component
MATHLPLEMQQPVAKMVVLALACHGICFTVLKKHENSYLLITRGTSLSVLSLLLQSITVVLSLFFCSLLDIFWLKK